MKQQCVLFSVFVIFCLFGTGMAAAQEQNQAQAESQEPAALPTSLTEEAPAAAQDATPAPAEEAAPAPALEESQDNTWDKIKPLILTSEDGRASIQFGFAAQLQMDATWKNVGENNEDLQNQFRFRRIQPFLKGHVLTKDLTYKFMVELIPGKLDIMDLFVDYKFTKQFRIRVGAQKVGFTRLRLNSWKNQALVDFSSGPRYFGSERQLGFTLHNGMGKKTEHEYEVGIYNGVATRPGMGRDLTPISKEAMDSPMVVSDKNDSLTEFHPEVVGHYAYQYNGIDVTTETDWAKTDFCFTTGLGVSYDPRPVAYRDLAMRLGLEAMTKYRGWTVFGTMWSGFYDKSDDRGSDDVSSDFNYGMIGAVIQTGYLIEHWAELAVRYTYVGTSEDLRKDIKARTEYLIQAAGDDEAEALASTYKGAGELKGDHEATFGLNFYPLGRNLKLAGDLSYLLKQYETKASAKDFRARMMMQLAF